MEMIDRKTPPIIKNAVEFDLQLPPYTEYRLKNDIPVYSVQAGEEDVMMIEFVFYAGNWYDNKNLVAVATNHLIKNGTSNKTAFEINEHFEFYGAYLNRKCYSETATISLHCLTKHLPALLPVIREIISNATFPEYELALFKQNSKQNLSVNLKKCDYVANKLIDEYLYGAKHPYGVHSDPEHYDELTREDLLAFYDQFYKNGNCKIFTAGKLHADLEEELNKNFGDLPLNSSPIPEIAHQAESASQKQIRIENDPDGVQGAIRIGRPFPNRHHPDFQKVQVMNSLFGGFFGSRLMRNIREDKGYTYGIYSFIENHIQESALIISTEAGKDVCEDTIKEVYNEMKILREELVSEEELMLVRNYLMGLILGDLDGPFHIIGRWKSLILNNLDITYFNRGVDIIKKIRPEEIKDLANKYLVPEDYYELVVI